MASRCRWLMTGPWPHPDSGIYYFRRATPKDIWDRRTELQALGIKVTKESHRSLETRDKKEAGRKYHLVAGEIETVWTAWRAMLQGGPTQLSHRNRVALAGEDARSLVQRHADEPLEVKWPVEIIKVTCDNVRAALGEQDLRVANAVHELAQELQALPRLELPERLAQLLRTESDGPRRKLVEALAGTLVSYRETVGWLRAPKLTAARGVSLTKEGRNALGKEIAKWWGKGWETLRAYHDGNYSDPEWSKGLPQFSHKANVQGRDVGEARLSLSYLLERKTKVEPMRPATVGVWRSKIEAFAKFIGHDDARRVTKDDTIRWCDSLLAGGKVLPKTISNKHLAALHSVLAYGVKNYGLPLNAADISRPRSDRAASSVGETGYSEEQAVKILSATFTGSRLGLSEPHRRAIKWLPWILAFTGLRVTEAAQFRGRHLKKEGETYFMEIRPEDGSTKSGKWWRVPLHHQLIELGLVDMFQEVGDGPAFYEAYPEGTDLQRLTKSHRATETGDRIAHWVRHELGITAPLGRPNHAWRHRFTTLCRDYQVDSAARDFMMGTLPSGKNEQREKYGTWSASALTREIEKLPFVQL